MTITQYNLYNLEAPFKQYLLAENLSSVSIKNYMSDLRHFIGWLTFYLKSHENGVVLNSFQDPVKMLSQVQHDTIAYYKAYLSDNNLPIKTINRRLSTIRKFCSFCILQGWMKENPTKKIQNQNQFSSGDFSLLHISQSDILKQFESDLSKENIDKKIIISYLDNIREFLQITKIL